MASGGNQEEVKTVSFSIGNICLFKAHDSPKIEINFEVQHFGRFPLKCKMIIDRIVKNQLSKHRSMFVTVSYDRYDTNIRIGIKGHAIVPNYGSLDFKQEVAQVARCQTSQNLYIPGNLPIDDSCPVVVEIAVKLVEPILPSNKIPLWFEGNDHSLTKNFRSCFELEMSSDIVLKVQDGCDETGAKMFYERKAIKAILAARSPVFHAMFTTGNDMKEGRDGVVIIEDLSPKGLDFLLNYAYTGEVSEDWTQIPLDVIKIAGKYDFTSLKNFCNKHIASACSPENGMELFSLVTLHGMETALKDVASYIAQNNQSVLQNFNIS